MTVDAESNNVEDLAKGMIPSTSTSSNDVCAVNVPKNQVCAVSRRRLAFRPPIADKGTGTGTTATSTSITTVSTSTATMTVSSITRSTDIPQPPTEVPSTSNVSTNDQAMEVTGEDSATTTSATTTTGPCRPQTVKRPNMWSQDEIMTYYESIKQYGKDFDAVLRAMGKRKIQKGKDQTKNFYFNSIKFIKATIGVDDDSPLWTDVVRDARELFLVVNACEWRKRTGSGKYVSEKLKELIFEGSTSIRWKKKTVVIKTPSCPALTKYFTMNRLLEKDKLPSDIVIELRPKAYADASYVVDCEQNPLLRLKLSMNDRICRLLKLLCDKWYNSSNKPSAIGDAGTLGIRLFAAKETELGAVSLADTSNSPDVSISLNKLRKEMDDKKRNNMMKQQHKSSSVNTESSYTLLSPHPFVLSTETLKEGVNMANVGNATVAELYCLCGMTNLIRMVYTVTISRKRPESAILMLDALTRGFGDAVSAANKDEEEGVENEVAGNIRVSRNSRTKSTSSHITSTPETPQAVGSQKTSSPQVLRTMPVIVESEVVGEELDAFQKQMRDVENARSKKGSATRALVSKISSTQSRITSFVEQQKAPLAIPMGQVTVQAGNSSVTEQCAVNKKYKPLTYVSQFQALKAAEQMEKQKRQKSNCSPATDFSQVSQSPALSFLSSLRTPEKTPVKAANRKTNADESVKKRMVDLFGEVSMSPGRSCSHINGEDLARGLFNDVSITPGKTQMSRQSTTAPYGTSDSMNGMVQSVMADMMTQNSVDFCQQFQPLLDLDTSSPKKKRVKVSKQR